MDSPAGQPPTDPNNGNAMPSPEPGTQPDEFPEGKDKYCPACYFANDVKILRIDCPHALRAPGASEPVAPTPEQDTIQKDTFSNDLSKDDYPSIDPRFQTTKLSGGRANDTGTPTNAKKKLTMEQKNSIAVFVILVATAVIAWYVANAMIARAAPAVVTAEMPYGSYRQDDGSIVQVPYRICGARDCIFAEEYEHVSLNDNDCLDVGESRMILCGTYSIHDLRPRD